MSRPRYDLNAIKSALPVYLEKTGCDPVSRKNGSEIAALCPIHHDHEPSLLAVEKEPGLWTWYCHVCGEGGTVIDLHAKRQGIKDGDAIGELGEMFAAPTLSSSPKYRPSVRARHRAGTDTDADEGDRIPGIPAPLERSKSPPPEPEPLTEDAAEECNKAVADLLQDENARREWAERLGVKPNTLAALAGSLDLGLVDGRLAYLAHGAEDWHGMQIRNLPGEKPRFYWKHGKGFLPWRGWRLDGTGRVRTVYLCEGQSDALALIDAGLEDPTWKDKVAVIAAPGTSFPDHWRDLFAFRHVILCGDRDEPGQKAVRKIGDLLLPVAESVRVFSWAGLETAPDAGDLRELYLTCKTHFTT